MFYKYCFKIKNLSIVEKFVNVIPVYRHILSMVMLYIVYKSDHEFKWPCDL